MGFFDFARRKALPASLKALTASGDVVSALENRQANLLPTLGGTNIDYKRLNSLVVEVQNASYGWIYRYSPPVRTVIEYIARNAAQLDVKVFERVSDDERRHVGDHPAARSIRQPNPVTPGSHFIFALFVDFLTFDNAYALKVPQPNGERQLYNIAPANVGILGRNYFAPDGYRVWNPYTGEAFDVEPEQMLHWRGHNPDKPRQGESKLETLREELAADRAALGAVSELHSSGLSLKGWLERPETAPPITPEGMERLREQIGNWMKTGKSRPAIFEEGMVFKTGGITPEDAEFIASRQFTKEYVAGIYGLQNVPPENEEERRQFYADVLPPFCQLCTSFLDLHILQVEYGRDDLYFEFSNEKIMDEVYKTLTSASGRSILTTNEARAKIDQPPIKGGDELVTPLNVIVGDNPKPAPAIMPIQDPNAPPQDGSHRLEDAPTPPGKALGRGGIVPPGSPLPLIDDPGYMISNGHHKAPLLPRRARASNRRDAWAKQYEDVFTSTFTRQHQSLKSSNKAVTAERWNKELAKDLNEVAKRHFHAEGDHVAFRLMSDFDPGQGVNWLDAKSVGAAEAVNETTAKHIEEKGLADAFAFALAARASAAGMAYATDVAAFSTKAAAQQAPVEPTVTIDGGTCDLCAPYQGSYPMSEVPEWPSYHPNCFPAGTEVSGPQARAALKRWYDGDLIELRFAGDRLTCTPNHPILTPLGWVAAQDLREGSNVIGSLRSQGRVVGDPHDDEGPAFIEQVAEALGSADNVSAASMPVAPEDFHGDGSSGNVDVVWTDSLAEPGRQSAGFEEFGEITLCPGHMRELALTSLRSLTALSEGGLTSTSGAISGFGLASALLKGHLGDLQELSLADVSNVDTSFEQAATDDDSPKTEAFSHGEFGLTRDISSDNLSVGCTEAVGRPSRWSKDGSFTGVSSGNASLSQAGIDDVGTDPELFSDSGFSGDISGNDFGIRGVESTGRRKMLQLKGASFAGTSTGDASLLQAVMKTPAVDAESFGDARFSGDIGGDDFFVKHVEATSRFPFSGYVYNLQTEDGWYTANNTVVHNCECVADVDAGVKAIEPETKAIEILASALAKAYNGTGTNESIALLAKAIAEQKPAEVHIAPAETHIHEGAVRSETTIQAPSPAEVTIAEGAVKVDSPVTVEAAKPANVTIEKGAVSPRFNIEAPPAPPPAEVNVAAPEVNIAPAEVRFGKGAIQVDAPPPANVNFEEGAFKVDVEAPPPAEVTIEPPPPANVNVTVEAKGKTKRTVKFSDGRTAEINEEGE